MSDTIFSGFTRPPVLFIGSGMSMRYVEGFTDWMGLLRRIANRIGIGEGQFIAFDNDARLKCGRELDTHLPYICDELESYLNDEIKHKRIVPEEFFTASEFKMYSERVNPIKIMVSSELSNLRLRADDKFAAELRLFESVADVIPCVVTTNYDTFLEDKIFKGKFAVYSDVSDYYDADSQGIGEIYKIHGTVENPSSMILNKDDYIGFKKKSSIVSANIMSVLSDYPMVIMGYSLDDPDVRDILNTMAAALNEDKLRKMESNIIYVSYKPDETKFISKPYSFGEHGRRLTINAIETDNFEGIFREISEMVPMTSPSLVRKFRQLVKNIIITGDPMNAGYMLLGVDNEAMGELENPIIAFGNESYVRILKEIPIVTTESMVDDILHGGGKYDPKAIMDYFIHSKKAFRVNEYVPIYFYAMLTDTSAYSGSQFFNDFTNEKNRVFKDREAAFRPKKFEGLSNIRSVDDLIDYLDSVPDHAKCKVIAHCYNADMISYDESIHVLKSMYDNKSENINKYRTEFNCVITYIVYKQWIKQKEQ